MYPQIIHNTSSSQVIEFFRHTPGKLEKLDGCIRSTLPARKLIQTDKSINSFGRVKAKLPSQLS